MPTDPLPTHDTHPAWRAKNTRFAGRRVLRLAMRSLAVLLSLSAALLLALQYLVMPQIDRLRPTLEQLASRAVKAPVTIGRIDVTWRGINPHLALQDVRITAHDASGLRLPEVEATVSWLSALAFEPRLTLLRIERPEVDVARLDGDRFSVAGLTFDASRQGGDSGMADWVLMQAEVIVRDAIVRYSDRRQSTGPAVVLTGVNLQLLNTIGVHRLGLQATPAAAIAAPLDVRAQFRHSPFAQPSDVSRWSGQLFGQVDYADLAALARIFDAPIAIERAQGALRTWVTFHRSRLTRVVADVALTNVSARLSADLKPLLLESLQGRILQRRWGGDHDSNGEAGYEIEVSRLALLGDRRVAPLDLKIRTSGRTEARHRTQIEANQVDLEDLAWVSARIPLPRELRRTLAAHSMRGTLTGLSAAWQGASPTFGTVTLKSAFAGLSSASQAGMPAFENLTGRVDVADGAGTLQLASKDAALVFPGVFEDPRVALARLDASLRWKSAPALEVVVASAAAANDDLEVEASGTYRANVDGQGPGWLDLDGRLVRLQAPHAYRYVPAAAGDKTLFWLQHALKAGRITGGAFRVNGDLARFPFRDVREGQMRVAARLSGATLDVHPERPGAPESLLWPLITGIDADLLIDRSSMTVTAQQADASGVQLNDTLAHIADLGREPLLEVRGVATGALSDMLRYTNASPVARWLKGITHDAQASGPARLALQLNIPLLRASDAKVAGGLTFLNNEVGLASAPRLSDVTGTLHFTRDAVRSDDLNATVFGGPARIEAGTRSDGIVLAATGVATVPGLRRALTDAPVASLLDRSQGQARYHATLALKALPELRIESDLIGMAIDGIAPLAKTAQEAMPLRIEHFVTDGERDEWRVTAGARALAMRLERRRENGEFRVTRGVVALNEDARLPESGVLILANVPRLDVQAWSSLLGIDGAASTPPTPSAGASIDLVAIRTRELVTMGRTFRDVTLGASRNADGGFDVNVVSDRVAGYIAWRPQQITARLTRLLIPAAVRSELAQAAFAGPPAADQSARATPPVWPSLDIAADEFELADLTLGRLELVARAGVPGAPAWRIDRLQLGNADMKVAASGEWTAATEALRMKMKFVLTTADAGATLQRLGFADAMDGGQGTFEGDVEWRGSPFDVDLPTLAGRLALNLDNGRFLKADGGNAARLLGLLSLQSLSRTLLLDGGRPFAEGFAFNSIRADARLTQGVVSTDNFRMAGASAAALLSGTINLHQETQQLHLVVLPEIDASTAALAIGVANPILGLGALLAQFVLRDPLSRTFAQEYDIGGTWTDPTVARRSRGPSASAPIESVQ